MKKRSLRFLTLTLIGILLYSCQKEDDFEKENLTSQNTKHKTQNKSKLKVLTKLLAWGRN
jgi:hypothetical protein